MQVRNYQIMEELGHGSYGITYLGIDATGRRVAIKTIDINKSQQLGADLAVINDEIDTLKQLSTPNCPKYMACYFDSFEDTLNGVNTMFIISEFIEGSSLTEFIKANSPNMPLSFLWPIYNQLILGLKYIHDNGYAHRDIKPDNILITNDFTIKYIDFGLACLNQCRAYSCTNTCKGGGGTLLYMPPEFFTGTRQDSLQASQAHDIWSLTMVFFELTNGLYKFPFNIFSYDNTPLSTEAIAQNIVNAPQISSNYNFDDGRTNNYLDSLVIPDWQSRPAVDALLFYTITELFVRVWQ